MNKITGSAGIIEIYWKSNAENTTNPPPNVIQYSKRGIVKKAEDFHKYRWFLLRMAKIHVTGNLTVFFLAKGAKRVYNRNV